MARKVALLRIFDGEKLVGLKWNNSTPADSSADNPTSAEKELYRIFHEHTQQALTIQALDQRCDRLESQVEYWQNAFKEIGGEIEEKIQLDSKNEE